MRLGNAGGAKGPQFGSSVGRGQDMGTGESLSAPQSVQRLQSALHAKAKGSPSFRFYSLCDKVWRADVLAVACQEVRRNGGAPGVDGQTVRTCNRRSPTCAPATRSSCGASTGWGDHSKTSSRVQRRMRTDGVGLKSLKEAIDTDSPTGQLVFHIFGALAEFERALIRERTQAGLQAARARGRQGDDGSVSIQGSGRRQWNCNCPRPPGPESKGQMFSTAGSQAGEPCD